MKGTLIIIKVDGSTTKRTYEGRCVPLEDLNRAVGGYLEVVPFFNQFKDNRCIAFCDEDGRIKNYKINAFATALWHCQRPDVQDHLVGDIAILWGDREFMEDL